MYLDTWDRPINPGKDEQLVIERLIALYLRRDGIPLLEMAGGREGWGGERQGRKGRVTKLILASGKGCGGKSNWTNS